MRGVGRDAEMDAIGFALENYNAIGQWRDKEEDTDLSVDASGRLADGREFDGVVAFKKALTANPDLLARAFVEQRGCQVIG